MNKILKMLIKEAIHNNPLLHTQTTCGDKYIIFDKQGHEVLIVDNGWANNHYSVSVNKKTVLAVKWDETNSKPLDSAQKDMLDIINVAKEKLDLQETVQTMTDNELETAQFLQKSLCTM